MYFFLSRKNKTIGIDNEYFDNANPNIMPEYIHALSTMVIDNNIRLKMKLLVWPLMITPRVANHDQKSRKMRAVLQSIRADELQGHSKIVPPSNHQEQQYINNEP